MINKEIHWDLLRQHLLLFIVCAGIAGSLAYYSTVQFNEVNKMYNKQLTRFGKLARDYRIAIKEEQLYRAYVDQFEQFTKKGYIGEEHRLVWIETLQNINRTLKLPVLKYNIKPRQPIELQNVDFSLNDKITVYESVMQLDLGLLHGGDLYVFLSELKKRARGLFEVRGCDLKLASTELRFDTTHPNVNALCQLAWYTIGVEVEEEPLEQ